MVDIITVLTSAAVGTLVGSSVTIIGQVLERRARRREMLFSTAVEMARRHFEAEERHMPKDVVAPLDPEVVRVWQHLWLIEQLFKHGELPEEYLQAREDEVKAGPPLQRIRLPRHRR